MHVRPNTVILCDEGALRTWSPKDKAFVPLRTEDSQLLCSLQFGRCSELPPEAAGRLTDLGALVSDADHFNYPLIPLKARSCRTAERGPDDVDKTLCISSQTQLRFLENTVYAWSPAAPIQRLRERYDRYLVLTPEASAVLLSFSTPATPREARALISSDSVSEQEFLRHVRALEVEGVLHHHPSQKTPKTSTFFVQVSQPETADVVSQEQVEEAPAFWVRLGESTRRLTVTAFLVLVYCVLIVPLGWMQRFRLSSRRARLRRSESTWEPCHTQGLRNKASYGFPF